MLGCWPFCAIIQHQEMLHHKGQVYTSAGSNLCGSLVTSILLGWGSCAQLLTPHPLSLLPLTLLAGVLPLRVWGTATDESLTLIIGGWKVSQPPRSDAICWCPSFSPPRVETHVCLWERWTFPPNLPLRLLTLVRVHVGNTCPTRLHESRSKDQVRALWGLRLITDFLELLITTRAKPSALHMLTTGDSSTNWKRFSVYELDPKEEWGVLCY